MTPELGNFALILALCMALVQASFPMAGAFLGRPTWMALGRTTAWGQFTFISIAFACLVYAFVTSDFSVTYVAQNSNTLLPIIYKVSAVWGGHEGSLLLWVLMLTGWGLAVSLFSRNLPREVLAWVLSVQGMVSIGFILFMLLTSNPFDRLFPIPAEGRDLNPLLQDPGLAIHPPMLYMGYVGFSVAFSFAVAALIGGRLDSAWARWSRPWTTIAWVFLSIGITMGSWWAYNELGWGGWWFWDPVENASFMPWLMGTALMHSLAVSEKRGAFKSWTVLLAISAFSLSLLGAFLVRSGVLTSVHAFAVDPARGIYLLVFLGIAVGGSLALYAWRASSVVGGGNFDLVSRETFLLGNNLVLVGITALVLLGTLYPLIYEAMGWGKISVGFPWFNRMFVAFMPLLVILMGIGAVTKWKHHDRRQLLRRLVSPLVLSAILGLLFALPIHPRASVFVGLGVFIAAWLLLSLIASIRTRWQNKRGFREVLRDLIGQGRSFYGMIVAHLGVAVAIIGVTFVSGYGLETDVRMAPGEHHELGGYSFQFEGITKKLGPNYQADRGQIRVRRAGAEVAVLYPEKRSYFAQGDAMTEAAIDVGVTRDLYVSLGEPLGGGAWSVRLYYKPFVRWIWLGGLLMALGGIVAVTDKRYRIRIGRKTASRAVVANTGLVSQKASVEHL
ncbi:MAG: heme lyase CcmF/NrfE family subunit [Gammaproteobacteria bacterium]|nr:heme lyase CcmF/NrfE family subunit [Gammaproteobacteria bacterium]